MLISQGHIRFLAVGLACAEATPSRACRTTGSPCLQERVGGRSLNIARLKHLGLGRVPASSRRLRWRRPQAGREARLAGCAAFSESFPAVFAWAPRAPRSLARLWAQPWSCAQRRTEVGPQGKAGARRGPCGPRAHRLPWGGLPEARPCGDARFTSGRRLLLAAAPSSTDQLGKSLARCLSTVLVISVFPSGSPRVEIGFFSREKI